jgi:fumarylacetoacetase
MPDGEVAAVQLGAVVGTGRPGPGRVVAPLPAGLLDVAALATTRSGPHPDLLQHHNLDRLIAAGRPAWREVHGWLVEQLSDPPASSTPSTRPTSPARAGRA